jgi:hypothetical protein
MSLKTPPALGSFPRAQEEEDEDGGAGESRSDRDHVEENGHL